MYTVYVVTATTNGKTSDVYFAECQRAAERFMQLVDVEQKTVLNIEMRSIKN